MTLLKKIALPIAVVAITAGATNTLRGSTLTVIPIPPWLPGTNVNEGRAISPDGKYVGGVAGTHAFSGFLYDVANNTVIQPNILNMVPSTVNGVAYRTDPVSGQKQLILDGMSSGYQANWMTADGGATWGARRRDTTFTQASVLPTANSLGAAVGSDRFYQIIRNTTRKNLWTNQGSNTWDSVTAPTFINTINKGIGGNDLASMNGVAATGRAVGYRIYNDTLGNYRCIYVLDYPPMSGLDWNFSNLAGTIEGEAFSISADGNAIFGQSPVLDRLGYWPFKAVVTSALNSLQRIDELPTFPDTGGSSSLGVPYGCSADGRYAVGMNYRGQEKAVLWDTGDPDTNNWTIVDLTDRATSEGILGNFTRLSRAYSVGVDEAGHPVITGIGLYFDGSATYTRAFVMVVGDVATPAPQPRITGISGAGTGSVTVFYTNTVADTNYVLQYSTNLSGTNWFTAGSKIAPGTSDSQTDGSAGSAQRYYRLLVQ
jgi:hypothetical protein